MERVNTTNVILHFACDAEGCDENGSTSPESMQASGWPICSECDDEMEYQGWTTP